MRKYGLWLFAGLLLVINIAVAVGIGLPGVSTDTDNDAYVTGDNVAEVSQTAPDEAYTDYVSAGDTVTDSDAQNQEKPEQQKEDLVFIQDPNCPLPWEQLNVQFYCDYPVRGTVESKYPIESITAVIQNTDKSEIHTYECEYDPAKNVLTCALDSADNELSGKSLDKRVDMAELKKGAYTFTLSAKNSQEEKVLYTGSFKIDWLEKKRLTPAEFRGNYAYALEFFGGDYERFMFGYSVSEEDRRISIEKEWRETYLKKVELFGELGFIHVDTEPYLNRAEEYINSSYIRVQGNGRDSGVIPLSSMVEEFAGAFVPRLVRNDNYISHHSFGTAMDLNAYTSPNTLNKKNWEIIRREVSENLTYNGLKTEDGITYYDFSYTGQSTEYVSGVPREIQNYLLYELAFYRAGFGWGYYFSHNCDAMHYTLTELDPALHEAEGTGLRKVFEYAP